MDAPLLVRNILLHSMPVASATVAWNLPACRPFRACACRPVGANTPGHRPGVLHVAPSGLAHAAPSGLAHAAAYLHASVVHLAMNGIYRRTPTKKQLCALCVLCARQMTILGLLRNEPIQSLPMSVPIIRRLHGRYRAHAMTLGSLCPLRALCETHDYPFTDG